MNYKPYSYRFAEEVLNSKMAIKREIEDVIKSIPPGGRRELNAKFKEMFLSKGWKKEVPLFVGTDSPDIRAKVDFLKERVAIEVAFTHSSFMGIDMLKFQLLSYSNPELDKIDVGVSIVATIEFQKKYFPKSAGSVTFEKVVNYLPHLRSAIQVPVWVIGLL